MHYMPTHTRQTISSWDSVALVRGVDDFEHCPRPTRDFDPKMIDFHERASKALPRIVYNGAQMTEPTL